MSHELSETGIGLPTQADIYDLEQRLLQLPQIDFQVVHWFADGLYGRQVTMQAGALVTSKIHLKEHFAFVLTGDISVWTDQDYQRITAPRVLVTQPGTKRILHAHEDTVWITVHATNTKTVAEAEAELVTNDPEMINRARQSCPSG